MAEHYRFFDSTGEDERVYTADEFAEYFRRVLSDGIFNGGTNLKVETKGSDIRTYIQPGYAWLQGYMYKIDVEPLYMQHAYPDPSQDRIDRVVIRLDKRLEHRYVKAFILQGTPSANPAAPALTRNENIFELSLAQVLIKAGKSYIEGWQITDERLDNIVCGLVNSLIQADTTTIFNQFQQWYNSKTAEFQKEWDDWFSSFQAGALPDDLLNVIKGITGKADWKTPPRTTLENAIKRDGDTMTGNLTVDGGGVVLNGGLGSWGTVNWKIALKLLATGIIFWPKGTGTRSIGIGKTNDDLLRIMANTTEDNTATVENLILVDAAKKVTFFNGDVDVSGGVNTQLKVQKSGKDSNGTFTTIEYRRQNNSLFLRCVLSNPDANGNYRTDTWTFYRADGVTVEESRVYSLTYDTDGDLVSATY